MSNEILLFGVFGEESWLRPLEQSPDQIVAQVRQLLVEARSKDLLIQGDMESIGSLFTQLGAVIRSQGILEISPDVTRTRRGTVEGVMIDAMKGGLSNAKIRPNRKRSPTITFLFDWTQDKPRKWDGRDGMHEIGDTMRILADRPDDMLCIHGALPIH